MFKKSGALLVAIGIFLSRIAGLVRERAFAHYFGTSDAGDAFKVALRIPNFLQNLFGEGVLSASFIPVYAQNLAQSLNQNKTSKEKDITPSEIAYTIGALLFFVTFILVTVGVLATPWLIDVIAPGFQGEKKELSIRLVQIIFPGTGLVVLSAWCLGILNTHRKFFISYVAPVFWNVAIIATIIFFGKNNSLNDLAVYTSLGVVAGSFLQLMIQLPLTLKLLNGIHFSLKIKSKEVQTILRNFIPSVISRGVVQVSSYIDNILASLLASGSVSNIAYAQVIYFLPVSLFGMSVSASELPEMSSLTGDNQEAIYSKLVGRLENAIKRVSFFIVPSTCAFLFNGDVIIAALFQTGHFSKEDTFTVWVILAGFAVGLVASTVGRLYSSSFYALKDTRSTLNFALIRITFSIFCGYALSFYLLPKLLESPSLNVLGLTLASSLGGILELNLLRNKLTKIIGKVNIPFNYQLKLWISAGASSAVAFVTNKFIVEKFTFGPIMCAIFVFTCFGLFYFILTYILKIEESNLVINKIKKKFSR